MAALEKLVGYCQARLGLPDFPDYPGAMNGLQMANDGTVSRIGAAVDAGLETFEVAAQAGVDFLIVHHGMFWEPPRPWTGATRRRLAILFENNIAVYSAHLPLDAHPELGNNARLARALGLPVARTFLPFEGRNIGAIASSTLPRNGLRASLQALFGSVTAIEFGSEAPTAIAVVTGSGGSAIDALADAAVDTLITGELREHHFVVAQEKRLNLYACGHYRTEVFGVQALAEDVSTHFGIPWQFLPTANPL